VGAGCLELMLAVGDHQSLALAFDAQSIGLQGGLGDAESGARAELNRVAIKLA
jgi:hypothetical protein